MPPPGRTNRWTITIILTALLSLIYFLQSEEARDRLVALQDVVIKNKSIRGIVNRTGISFQDVGLEDELLFDGDDNVQDDDEAIEAENEESDEDEAVEAEKEAKEDEKPAEAEAAEADVEAKEETAKETLPPKADENKPDSVNESESAQDKQEEKVTDSKEDVTTDGSKEEGEAKTIDENEPKEQADAAKKDETNEASGNDNTAETPAGDTPAEETAEEYTAHETNECASKCSTRSQQQKDRWGGDLLDTKDVGRLAKEAYDKLIAQLKVDYGEEHFAKIFQVDGKSRGRTSFLSANVEDGVSLKRFKRKLKMKVLEVQMSIAQEQNSFGDCDCRTGAKLSNRRFLEGDDGPLADQHERFVWATGGHSSAAGHGNLFNESYTAVMEHALEDIFGSIGIEFEGRNYAMGGTDSAPEIALCGEAIFGTDVDVISYDHCMTDGRNWDRKGMYANRGAGLNPGRPVIVDMFIDKFVERRVEELQKIEERGLAGLYMNTEMFQEMKDGIPDTFGLNSEQINALPPFVRHFKCQDTLEKGDPTCTDMKFDDSEVCPDRRFMSAWHPGWKMMALWGNTLALFVSETLLDAIDEMSSISGDRAALLRHLRNEEDVEYKTFADSDVPPLENDFLRQIGDELLNETDMSVFYRSPSICHTGRLPAQIRYLGILTESDKTGVYDYDKGMPKENADKLETEDEMAMPLVYDPNDRQTCEIELNRDYKDFFFASDKMGWSTVTIPNKAELEAYGRDSQTYRGLLVMCLKYCDWGKCPAGDMQLESIQKGQVEFEVNGVSVVNVTKFSDCGVLRGEQGHYWKANDDGQYVLKAKVLGDGSDFSYLRISSLILL